MQRLDALARAACPCAAIVGEAERGPEGDWKGGSAAAYRPGHDGAVPAVAGVPVAVFGAHSPDPRSHDRSIATPSPAGPARPGDRLTLSGQFARQASGAGRNLPIFSKPGAPIILAGVQAKDQFRRDSVDPLELTVAIGSIVASAAAAISLAILAWQASELRRSRRLDATLWVFQDLGSEEARLARRQLYIDVPDDPRSCTPDQLRLIEAVTNSMERAAYLAMNGLADEATIFGFYREAYCRCWSKLQGYVEEARKTRGPRYLYGFEAFGTRACALGDSAAFDHPPKP